jgi:hypothetical protein
MKPKKLYIYNGIEGELEEISDLKEAKSYIKDYVEYGDIHPDIESIIILEQIGGVTVEETGEETKLNGDVVPICKVDVFVDKGVSFENKYTEEDLRQAIEKAIYLKGGFDKEGFSFYKDDNEIKEDIIKSLNKQD